MRTTGVLHLSAHLLVFFVFGVLLASSLGRPGIRLRILALMFGVVLGASAELYEHLAFGNEMEYIDVAMNTFGVLLGFAVEQMLLHRTRG